MRYVLDHKLQEKITLVDSESIILFQLIVQISQLFGYLKIDNITKRSLGAFIA